MSKNSGFSEMQRLSRRTLLGSAAALGVAAVTGPARAAAASPATRRRVPGIQLYTVRASMAADVPGTLRAIAGIGYREVEFAGYGDQSPRQIRNLLNALDLRAPSAHMDARALRDDPGPLIETAAEIGHDYVTIGWLDPGDRRGLDDYKAWADTCNRVGEACRARGLRLAYHNHDFELRPLAGRLPYDILLDETEPGLVDFQLDFYWVRKAGSGVVAVLEKSPGRFTMAHIKDMGADGRMVDVGAGTIDFATILADPAARGLRHLFVEHDDAGDPFKSAALSHLALQSILR